MKKATGIAIRSIIHFTRDHVVARRGESAASTPKSSPPLTYHSRCQGACELLVSIFVHQQLTLVIWRKSSTEISDGALVRQYRRHRTAESRWSGSNLKQSQIKFRRDGRENIQETMEMILSQHQLVFLSHEQQAKTLRDLLEMNSRLPQRRLQSQRRRRTEEENQNELKRRNLVNNRHW